MQSAHLCGLEGAHQVLVDVPGVGEAGQDLGSLCLSPGDLLQLPAVHRVPLLGPPHPVLPPHRTAGWGMVRTNVGIVSTV